MQIALARLATVVVLSQNPQTLPYSGPFVASFNSEAFSETGSEGGRAWHQSRVARGLVVESLRLCQSFGSVAEGRLLVCQAAQEREDARLDGGAAGPVASRARSAGHRRPGFPEPRPVTPSGGSSIPPDPPRPWLRAEQAD